MLRVKTLLIASVLIGMAFVLFDRAQGVQEALHRQDAIHDPDVTSQLPSPALPEPPAVDMESPTVSPSEPAGVYNAARATESESTVVVRGGWLTVRVGHRNLRAILQEISRKAGVPIVSAAALGSRTISIAFEGLSLVEGIRRLASDYDCYFLFRASAQTPALPGGIWIYPKGQGDKLAKIHTKQLRFEQELDRKLSDSDPGARAHAFEVLLTSRSGRTLDSLMKALEDTDAQVRYRALSMAIAQKIALASPLLEELIEADPSEIVRLVALSAIATDPKIGKDNLNAIAGSALHDPDPVVQTKALEILDQTDSELANDGSVVPETEGAYWEDALQQ